MNFSKIFFTSLFLFCSCVQKPAQIVHRGKNVYDKNRSQTKINSRNPEKSRSKQIEEENLDNISYQPRTPIKQPAKENPPAMLSEKKERVYENIPSESSQALKTEEKIKDTKIEKKDSSEEKKDDNKKASANQIKVETGDTLFGIARKFKVPIRDIIDQNSLNPPYNLKVGSLLNIPSPSYYEVKSGDTLYSIARNVGMKISSLVELNKMIQEPYSVKVGQKIRIASFATSENEKIEENKSEKTYSLKSPENIKNDKAQENQGSSEIVANKNNRFDWPIKGQIISKFGPKKGGLYNDGINIKAKEGAAVKSAEDGLVAYVGNELKGYGNLVIIKHSGGWITAYAHLSDFSVSRGQKISKGQKIGSVGASGNVTSPQLYFGLRKGRDAVNPQNYLK